MKRKAIECEDILKQRITVNNIVRYLEAIPSGINKNSTDILSTIKDWINRDSTKRIERKNHQEQSRKIHPTYIAHSESSNFPDGIKTMTFKIKPTKVKKGA
jgi:hypothetical protein